MTAIKAAFTSFSHEGYLEYGRRNIETFLENWPKSIDLTVYFDVDETRNRILKDFNFNERIKTIDNHALVVMQEFLYSVSYFPLLRGEYDSGQGLTYDYRMNARFGRKPFIYQDAILSHNGMVDKLFWIDGDVITHRPMPEEFLDEVLRDDAMISYLGRHGMHSECGFIGFNLNNIYTAAFVEMMVGIYKSGTFVTMGEWHDSFVFDVVREAFEQQVEGGTFQNLSPDFVTGKNGHIHVFVDSPLGKYMDHLKGNRKHLNRSPEAE
jgi:hypothetical protein